MKKCLIYMGMVLVLVFALASGAYAESRPHTDTLQEKSICNLLSPHLQMQRPGVERRENIICTKMLTNLSEVNPVSDRTDQREPEADAENLANSEKVLVILAVMAAALFLALFLFRKR